MDIGKKIRILRLQNSMNQIELANIIGVSKSTMSNYERNYSTPDPDILIKLADYFNVTIDFLFDYEEKSSILELTKESSNYNRTNVSFTKDEWNLLTYYTRLNDEHKDFIKGQMIQLYLQETTPPKDN